MNKLIDLNTIKSHSTKMSE